MSLSVDEIMKFKELIMKDRLSMTVYQLESNEVRMFKSAFGNSRFCDHPMIWNLFPAISGQRVMSFDNLVDQLVTTRESRKSSSSINEHHDVSSNIIICFKSVNLSISIIWFFIWF